MVAKFLLIVLWIICLPIALCFVITPILLAILINVAIFLLGLSCFIMGLGSIIGFYIGAAIGSFFFEFLDNDLLEMAESISKPCWGFWQQTYTSILYYKSEGFLY